MPPDEEEEFFTWFESLSPDEQNEFLYSQQLSGANQVPYSFGGAMAPGMDEGAFDLLSMDGGAALPEFTSKGALDPYDLTQAAKRFNLMQDYATGSVDNALAMFAGPGAYDADAFDESVTMPTDRANDSGARMLQQYAQGGGYEGYIAQKILSGATPSQAYAELMDLVNTEPTGEEPPEAVAQREALVASLPRVVRTGPVPPGEEEAPFDTDRLLNFGNDLFEATFKDDQPVWTDPETGVGYMSQPEVEKSPASEWYETRGLPTPVANYTDPEYIDRFIGAADPNFEDSEMQRLFGIQDAEQRATQALSADREADQIYQAQARGLRDYEGLQAQENQPTGFRTGVQQPRRAMARSEGMGAQALARRVLAPPQEASGMAGQAFAGGPRPLDLNRRTFDPMAGRPRQQADAALTNLASTFQQGGFEPRYSGDKPTPQPMVNTGTGAVSLTLGGIQDNPEGPFDFATALGNPKRNKPLDKGRVSQSRAKRDTKSRAARAAITDRYRQQHVNTTEQAANVAYNLGMASGLARSGRTPLQDALMQRVLGQRAMGGRG